MQKLDGKLAWPTSIFHENGAMRKTNKAELLGKLEEGVESMQRLPHNHDVLNAVYIRDAMGVIQPIKGDSFRLFDVLALQYLGKLSQLIVHPTIQ